MQFDYIYGVPIFKFDLANFELHRQELIDKATYLLNANKYQNKSNMGGFHSGDIGELDWNSFDAGNWLMNNIQSSIKQASVELKYSTVPRMTNSWYVINRAKSSEWNLPHTHPNSILSRAFYVQCSESTTDSGTFIGIPNNSSVDSLSEHYTDKIRWPGQLIFCPPVEGQLILFPSSLIHMVSPHMADIDRIMISFNTTNLKDD